MAETGEARTRAAVIVPTRDRPRSLAGCLDALDRQAGPDRLEVVVVDDGSLDAAAVAAAVQRSRRARLVRRERAEGPAAARNHGARETDAPVLLFTDDDCEPAPDWAEKLTAAVERGAHVVAGRTSNGRPDDRLATASETILAYVQDRARDGDSTTLFAATNNLACAAPVLAEIPFDEDYRYGEDRDWCARIRAAGYALCIEPSALVEHRQDLGVSSFLRQQFGYGRGAYRYRRGHATLGRFEAPTFYAGLLRSGFAHGVTTGVLVGIAQAATAAGFAREAIAKRR
jgi:GT2 family glycosyltransferase